MFGDRENAELKKERAFANDQRQVAPLQASLHHLYPQQGAAFRSDSRLLSRNGGEYTDDPQIGENDRHQVDDSRNDEARSSKRMRVDDRMTNGLQ